MSRLSEDRVSPRVLTSWISTWGHLFAPSTQRLGLAVAALAVLSLSTASMAAGAAQAIAPTVMRAQMPDSADIPEVSMGEYMIAHVSDFPKLESFGASTCVMVTLWDPRTSTGVLAHVSAGTNITASFAQIFARLQAMGVQPAYMQARLIGGWKGWSERIVDGLEQTLAQRSVVVVERDVLNPDVPGPNDLDDGGLLPALPGGSNSTIKSLIFDLQTGVAFDYTETVAPPGGHHVVKIVSPLLQPQSQSL